jgi:hypothetical protein
LFSSRQENEKLVDDLDLAINEIEKDNHHQVYPVSRQILMLSGITASRNQQQAVAHPADSSDRSAQLDLQPPSARSASPTN